MRVNVEDAIRRFREHGGMLRTRDALRLGIHPRTLYFLRDSGMLDRVCRGLYRLADASPLSDPDLVVVAVKAPRGVVCLVSALAFHDLTSQIPHEVYVAIERNMEPPRLVYPPVRVLRFTGAAFTEGIESHTIDNVRVRVYGPEKTLADCLKFRNQIGLDTAVEALRFYRERCRIRVDELMRFAAVCRVTSIMRRHLEVLL